MRRLLGHFVEDLCDFDAPVWRTIIGLTRRPGIVCREYVDGRRRQLANPVKYFLITGALWVLVLSTFVPDATEGFEKLSMMLGTNIRVTETANSTSEAASSAASTSHAPATAGDRIISHINDISTRVPAYSNWFVALTVPFMALLLWVLFYRQQMRVAEHAVLCLYGFGHLFLVTTPLAMIGLMGTAIGSLVLSLLPVAYLAWAARHFYRVGWFSAIWKMVLLRFAQLMAASILVLITIAIIVTWRMLTG